MKSLNRRNFLKGGLASGLLASFLGKENVVQAREFSGYTDKGMGVLVDLSRCVGCRSCEAACNREQGLPEPEVSFDDFSVFDIERHGGLKRRTSEGVYTVVNRYNPEELDHPLFRKFQCNHCEEPACLTSCFVNAYTKTPEGAVMYDPKVCVGCRNCMIACPFYVPAYSYSKAFNPIVEKCIMCYPTRLKFGKPPACVEACPTEALTFGSRVDVLKFAHERIRSHPDSYVDHVYGEKEVGGTAWLYISPVDFRKIGFDMNLGHQPIINYVKSFLAIVPMVLTIWPALFAGFYRLANRKDGLNKEKIEGAQEESQS